MAGRQKLDQIFRIWELFKTVCKGAEYLVRNPENKGIQRDLSTGLRALDTQLKSMRKETQPAGQELPVFIALAALLDGGERWGQPCMERLEQAAAMVAEQLSLCFSAAIQTDEYLCREQAQPLFIFCAEAPHACAAIYQLIFELCEKAAVSMPQESFDWTVRAFEEQPGILSGEGKPHPDYCYRPAPQRVFDRCPICGGAGMPYYRALACWIKDFRHPHLPAKLWMRCGGCGNLYTWKYPEELLTQAEHPALVQPDTEKALTAIRQHSAFTLSIWSSILNRLCAYTNGKDLLEVGVGEGSLLAVALEMGYQQDAVEIVRQSAQAVADVLQIPIWNGDFLDYHPDKKYSVIIMGDVIEHVTDPGRALRNAHSLLADDGVLWLSTPNFESSFTRTLKFRDPMWQEPYHISYFSFNGLRALAEQCGFAVREYQVSSRYNGSMELILTKAGGRE